MEEEQAIINNFINDHEVIVLKEYPGNGVFHKNEFVKLENGVYLHVIGFWKWESSSFWDKDSVIC